MLQHVSIIRSSSGSIYYSLLKLHIKTISDILRYINFGDVAACRVSVCVLYPVRRQTCVLPEDDRKIEICRRTLSVLM